MTLEDAATLSCYKRAADLSPSHRVELVQHTETGRLYVRKELQVYNPEVFRYLMEHPIPNTPRIYHAIEEEGKLIVIEEYLPGDSLQEILEREGPLSEDQVLDYAIQLCSILRDFHRSDPPLIHRDIKPSNLLISPDGVLKLLDMNAAKWFCPEETIDTILLGTSGYAAPEQYGFGASSVQTDLYSVGVLLNVMFTGKFPQEEPAQGHLSPLIRQCLRVESSARYSSADTLLEALTALRDRKSGPQNWRRYLPPGYRGSLWAAIAATLGYWLLLFLTLQLQVEPSTPGSLLLNRVFFLGMGLAIILFSGNYLNIQALVPPTRSRNPLLRFFGILLCDLLILVVFISLLVTLENLFWPWLNPPT